MHDTAYDVFEDDLVQELIDGLTFEERHMLYSLLRKRGYSGWMKWFANHGEAVERYLSGTPKERDQMTVEDVEYRLLLIYGAFVFAQLSGRMSHWFHNPELVPEWRDRKGRRAAQGHLLWQAKFEPWDPWPFDEPQGLGSPFAGD